MSLTREEMMKEGLRPDVAETVLSLYDKIDNLEMENHEMQVTMKCRQERICRLEGVIDALKFAIRCNGVSGSEVTG